MFLFKSVFIIQINKHELYYDKITKDKCFKPFPRLTFKDFISNNHVKDTIDLGNGLSLVSLFSLRDEITIIYFTKYLVVIIKIFKILL